MTKNFFNDMTSLLSTYASVRVCKNDSGQLNPTSVFSTLVW